MTIKTLAPAFLAIAVATAPLTLLAKAPSQGQQGTSQAKPDPKVDPKADPKASPAGKWAMNIETQGGARQATLDIKIDDKDKKVTGTITSEIGETAVTGELVEGKLTFKISFEANGQTLNITFTGTTQKDGSLAGTATMDGGDMTWTATRVKG